MIAAGQTVRFRRAIAGHAWVLFAQGATTGAGALAGLLIVRALPAEAYAHYTVGLAVLGAITLLADSGTTMAALAQGGKVWRSPRELGAVMRLAWAWRNKLAALAVLIAVPALIFLLRRHGASWAEVFAWIGGVGGLFALNLRGSLLEVPLRLHQQLRVTQGVAVGQALLRLGAVAASLLVWPAGIFAALAGGLPQAWANWRLGRAGAQLIAEGEPVSPEVARELTGIVKRSVPGAVYTIVAQQAGVWFLSVAGTTVNVAQLGALSRVGLLLGVIASVAQALWVPQFARLENTAALRVAYVKRLGAAGVLCLPLAAVAWVWPKALLWLVGPTYAGLEGELRLAVVAAGCQVVGGVSLLLAYARGWLPPPFFALGVAVAVQVACVALGDVTTLDGVLWMGVFLGLQTLLVHVGYLMWKTRPGRA